MKRVDPRHEALKILVRCEEGAYSGLLIDNVLKKTRLSAKDKALLVELVYGTLRWQGTIDYILKNNLKGNLHKLTPWIRNILRMGLYQIYFLERIPAYAAVDEAVKLAYRYGHKGTAGLVNAVLRAIAEGRSITLFPDKGKDPAEFISVCLSQPKWLVERWIEEFGIEETEKLAESLNSPAPLYIRANTLKVRTEELVEHLQEEGVRAHPVKNIPDVLVVKEGQEKLESTSAFREGLFYIQDLSSALVAHILAPKAGERVLDMCAAPGGKTTHIAQLMEGKGEIVAVDRNKGRLHLIEENVERLGIGNVRLIARDARELREEFVEWADRVLLDAPCSNIGVLRRRVEVKWRMTPEKVRELQVLQLELLRAGCRYLKRGGVLVYSVCTITREETFEVVEKFLAEQEEMRMDEGSYTEFARKFAVGSGMFRTLPHKHNCDGVFIARMVKAE